MAAATVSKEFLTKKAGPLPVYGWGVLVLSLAWIYSKYQAHEAAKASSSAASSSTDSSAAEPSTGAPYYVIENNIPGGGPNTSTTVATPPGTSPTPPTNTTTGGTITPGNPTSGTPILQGGRPPSSGVLAGHPLPVASASTTPVTQKYTVQRGDTLWGIAQKFTGNGANDTRIWTYNTPAARKAAGLPPVQGSNKNLIYPGEVFLIPPK